MSAEPERLFSDNPRSLKSIGNRHYRSNRMYQVVVQGSQSCLGRRRRSSLGRSHNRGTSPAKWGRAFKPHTCRRWRITRRSKKQGATKSWSAERVVDCGIGGSTAHLQSEFCPAFYVVNLYVGKPNHSPCTPCNIISQYHIT